MYIAIYVSVIVSFCGLSLFLFFFFRNREKRKLEEFNKSGHLNSKDKEIVLPNQEPNHEKSVEFLTDEELNKNKVTVEAQFEDFSLNMEDEKESQPKNSPNEAKPKINSTSLEDKFAEYEQFLQKHMSKRYEEQSNKLDSPISSYNPNMDNFEDSNYSDQMSFGGQEDAELDALANFDFDMLKGKTESEIEAIISSLPEKAQEILRNDILGRKDID